VLSEVPLSITTTAKTLYKDTFGPDGLLRYSYRGTNPEHHENRGLRLAKDRQIPLVYCHGITPGKYLVSWPVYIVGDDPRNLAVTVAVDDSAFAMRQLEIAERGGLEIVHDEDPRRRYITATVKVRLHQRAFRERVLDAYKRQCALCRFKHEELLDAAHIVPDADPDGEPRVSNGMALCSLHHSAFDRFFIAITPEYRVIVRSDLMIERDGPTLQGLQSLQDSVIQLPRRADHKPSKEFLQWRMQRFVEASKSRLD
jgi:putative restriction endonuclease